jgi:crotonobetaine/carnitine-CoA ligase
MLDVMTPEQTFASMVAEGDVVLDKLDECARTVPDKVFVHYGEDGMQLTFAEFKRRTDRIAAGLAALGVTEGVPVSVLTRNSLLSALAMFAFWRAGGIFAPVNFNFRGMLLSYQLKDTAPFALITDPSFAEVLGEVIDEVPLQRLIVHTPQPGDHDFTDATFGDAFKSLEVVSFAQLAESDAPVPAIPRGPFDLANIVYTSGTTGPSKGVLQPFRWMNHYGFQVRQLTSPDDVIYCDLPLYHVGGAFFLLARAVWQGNTVGLWDKFSPTRFWDRVAECGATTCVLLDVMVPYLMSVEPRANDRANTLNKVHMQPFPRNHHEVAQRFGIDFMTVGFGQTESGSAFAAVIDQFGHEDGTPRELWRGPSKPDILARCKAIGRPVLDGSQALPKGLMGVPNPLFEVAILDEDDNVLPSGQVGQLAFRPRFPGLLLQEYFRKPEATIKVFRTCWFHTGDACKQLDDGSGLYCFVDRMGGFFRVRGENVSSFEVEALIASHDRIRAVAAVPIPAKVGEEEDIAVFIELVEGEALTEDELRDHTRRVMPKYMQPAHVRFVPALPVTPTNKVEKYKLKRQIVDELNSSASQA